MHEGVELNIVYIRQQSQDISTHCAHYYTPLIVRELLHGALFGR